VVFLNNITKVSTLRTLTQGVNITLEDANERNTHQ